ncbi:hypothetical protein UFOVP1670_28 [uncultured Caudovirales phage]|uniref:Large polyvalent protein associated domain-containing protein n=1 Tax=uncultured Caudovirales phage TaxID=2100421 RepID=A0A6J5T8D8_9CAUD|nr:hypothetical protein UFOVP1670_28 [uncultured Caudovirales phage]
MSLDLYQDQLVENVGQLTPTTELEPNFWEGFGTGVAKLPMRAGAAAYRTGAIALSTIPLATEKAYNAVTGKTSTLMSDRFFKSMDDVGTSAVDYWTPKANEVGLAGQMVGSLLSILPVGPIAALSAQDVGVDLVKQGVSPGKAAAVGGVQAAGLLAGMWMPMLGTNLWQRALVGGAGANVAQGFVTAAASETILAGTPAKDMYDAFSLKDRAIDAVLGLHFGVAAHLIPGWRQESEHAWRVVADWAKGMSPSEVASVATLREAQHLNADSTPGIPVGPQDIEAHVQRMRTAIDQMVKGEPVNIENIKTPGPQTPSRVVIYRGEVPRAPGFDPSGQGIGQFWTRDRAMAERFANGEGGTLQGATVSSDANHLVLTDFLGKEGEANNITRTAPNEEGLATLERILGDRGKVVADEIRAGTDTESALQPEDMAKIKAAGIDVVTGSNIEGTTDYVLNPRALEPIRPDTGEPLFAPDEARRTEQMMNAATLLNEANTVRREEGIPRLADAALAVPNDLENAPHELQARHIGEAITQRLRNLEIDAEQAQANGAIWQAFFKTAADKYGVSPAELLRQYGIDVQRMNSAENLPDALMQRQRHITDSPEFKEWFADSKVTKPDGTPELAIHLTNADITQFSHEAQAAARLSKYDAETGRHTDPTGYTTEYGREFVFPENGFFFFVGEHPPTVGNRTIAMPVHLSIKNPLDLTKPISPADAKAAIEFLQKNSNEEPTPGQAGHTVRGDKVGGLRNAKANGITPKQLWDIINDNTFTRRGLLWDEMLKAMGKDGLIMEANSSGTSLLEANRGRGDGKVYKVAVALRPEQIKSAIGNRGTFDPTNPNILFQKGEQPLMDREGAPPRRGLDDEHIQRTLQSMADHEAGWETVGGKLDIARLVKEYGPDAIDEHGRPTKLGVVAFTSWIPRAEWWLTRPGHPGRGLNEAKTQEAVRKALAGEKMNKLERDTVDHMVDVINERLAAEHELGEDRWNKVADAAYGEGMDPTTQNVVDTDLLAKAMKANPEAIMAVDEALTAKYGDSPSAADQAAWDAELMAEARRVLNEAGEGQAVPQTETGQAGARQADDAGRGQGEPSRTIPSDIAPGETYYHGTRSDIDGLEGTVYLTNDPREAGSFARGEIPGTGRADNTAEPTVVHVAPKGHIQVKDVNDIVNDAVMNDEDVDVVVARELATAKKEAYGAIAFMHPGINTDEFVALVPTFPREWEVQTKGNASDRTLYQRDEPDTWYYSELAKQLNAAQMKAAPAKGWLDYLKSLPQKGVKADEIKWSGLEEWLTLEQETIAQKPWALFDLKKAVAARFETEPEARAAANNAGEGFTVAMSKTVTKEQITDYLAGNGVRVQEVMLGEEPTAPRGSITFDAGKTVIRLFETANASTFAHESAHLFLQMTRDLAMKEGVPPAAMQDWATLAGWLKLEGGEIPVAAHEQFARGWEKYLQEGVAPNEALKGVFQRFRDWLLQVYQNLTSRGLDVELTDEVRGVMGRMLDSQAKDPSPIQAPGATRAETATNPSTQTEQGQGAQPAPADTASAAPGDNLAGEGKTSSSPDAGKTPGEPAGKPDMVANEANRIAAERPDIRIRVGTEADGSARYMTAADLLATAKAEANQQREQVGLIAAAAECLLGTM